ncbi:unnamed protein product [Orchesella dallaii]|uniref:Uncharacterized protein n=1 Tax=Orchesella dallaii TaxID=48710 RepID=A0ABP1PPV3_9HEXA
MDANRKLFKKALQKCKRRQDQLQQDELALSYSGGDFGKFWGKIRQQGGTKTSSQCSSIDGVSGDSEIAEHWASLYKTLFNQKQDGSLEIAVKQYINNNSKSCDQKLFNIYNIVNLT